MLATILGALPRPPLPVDAAPIDVLEAVVRAQEAAGLEPISDAGFGVGATAVERWQATAVLTRRPVKAALPGPYSAGQSPDDRLAAADELRRDVLALAAAGCPIVEIHEPGAISIGSDAAERAAFRAVHARLLAGVAGTHLSLAITGGNANEAGIETLFPDGYASLAVDLIAGPDNWRLVVGLPGDRGVICGALSVAPESEDRVEVLLWAAGYAASTGGRGPSRVGLATASSLAALTWDAAVRKLAVLGEAARIANLPPREQARAVDPRSLDLRSAATGRPVPRRRRPG